MYARIPFLQTSPSWKYTEHRTLRRGTEPRQSTKHNELMAKKSTDDIKAKTINEKAMCVDIDTVDV